MKNEQIKWILLGIAVFLLITNYGKAPKLATAHIHGQPCNESKYCPCWGEYEQHVFDVVFNETWHNRSIGIGFGTCNLTGVPVGSLGTCDMTFCIDAQPAGAWLRDNPWAYLKERPAIHLLIIGLAILAIAWPK